MTAANRPVFPLKLPRWSCNLRQQVYNCRESVFKMEIPAQPNNPPKLTFSVGKGQYQMRRRTLIQNAAGMGLLGGFLGNPMTTLYASETGASSLPVSPATDDAQVSDWDVELAKRIAELEDRGGGTLQLNDGVYQISKTLQVPTSVSLFMTPNAVIRAKADFVGEAVVLKKAIGDRSKFSHTSGWIRGGVIDGARQPLTGIQVEGVERFEIADLVVLNATNRGIHMLKGGYERNITRVRCDVDQDIRCHPGSIGVHYEGGDCKVILMHVIGYETGVRSDSGSNWFTTIHVWNWEPTQGPMFYSFYCNGGHNTFMDCYADTPTTAGFYVNAANQSFLQCHVFYSRWAKDNSGAGFLITPNGQNGSYYGNVIYAKQDGHRLAKAFDGDLEGACILANTTLTGVMGGLENRMPSGGSGVPPLNLAGTGFRLTQQLKAPLPEDGEPGEVRWVDDGKESALWVKTTPGWKKSKLV